MYSQGLCRRGHDGVRTRYFFAGLTEEIVKTAVPGVQDDDAFAVVQQIEDDTPSGWTDTSGSGDLEAIYDEDRRQDVLRLTPGAWAYHGQHRNGSGASQAWGITDRRVLSLWIRATSGTATLTVTLRNSADAIRSIRYEPHPTSGSYSMDSPVHYADNDTRAHFYSNLQNDGTWRRLERNLVQDFQAAWPGETFGQVAGLSISTYGTSELRIAQVRLSNSMTVERNSLLPGSIGQVAYRRSTDPQTYVWQDRWNSYNHIGNVVGISNASGYFVEAVNTDAFGNPLASTQTGEWTSGLGGNRGLTTKELDPAAGMYYFYQRWYDPQTATFASRAPYPPMMEHPYGSNENNPLRNSDPRGEWIGTPVGCVIGFMGGVTGGFLYGLARCAGLSGEEYRECVCKAIVAGGTVGTLIGAGPVGVGAGAAMMMEGIDPRDLCEREREECDDEGGDPSPAPTPSPPPPSPPSPGPEEGTPTPTPKPDWFV